MRYLELLEQIELVEAARDKYMPMLNFLDQLPARAASIVGSAKDAALVMAEQAISTLGNADRIVWAMRLIRVNTLSQMIYSLKNSIDKLQQVASANPVTDLEPEEQEAGARVVGKWREKLEISQTVLKTLENIYNKDVKKMHANAQKEIRAELEVANQRVHKLMKDFQAIRDQAATNPEHNFEQSEERANEELQDARRMQTILAAEADKPFELRSFSWNALTNISHYLGIAYQPIHDYRFGWKPQNVIEGVLHEYETRWQNKKKRTVSHGIDEYYDKIENVLEFSGGKIAWFNLHEQYCKIEGDAMGHCGNDYENMQPGDEILSLREYVGQEDEEDIWKPHLTFVYNTNDQSLSEMKGYKNQKPSEEYHKFIVPLLEQPWVAGIKLRAHQHEKHNNFFISDLPQEEALRLYKEKPALATFRDLKELGVELSTDDMPGLEEINTHLEELNIEEIQEEDDKNFILRMWDNWGDAYRDISGGYSKADPDDMGVPGDDDWDSIMDQFSQHTKDIHKQYAVRYYPAEAREEVGAEEDADMREVLEELGFEQAVSILRDMNDFEVTEDIIVEKWREYHASMINQNIVDMMKDLKRHNLNMGWDPSEEGVFPELDYEIGPYPVEGNEDAYAITIDKDTFYSEVWPALDEEAREVLSGWFEMFGLHTGYYDSPSDIFELYFGSMEQEQKDWHNGQIARMADDEVYRAMREHARGGEMFKR